MPDAALYLKSLLAAAGAAALCVLAGGGWRRPAGAARLNAAGVLAVGLGSALGYEWLRLRPAWPPAGALGRFLTIVLPAVLLIELIAGFERVPRRLAWLLRLALAASAGRILLHGSVYLAGPHREWTWRLAALVLAGGAALLATEWGLLSWLARRAPSAATHLALSMAMLCGGIGTMLAGYIGGGAASMPLAAALAGAAVALAAISQQAAPQGIVGVGVVGLFSLLVIGRFFGELTSAAALTVFLSPLLCWASEAPPLGRRNPWLKGFVGLLLSAIPLALVLLAAKARFDQEMAPLLR